MTKKNRPRVVYDFASAHGLNAPAWKVLDAARGTPLVAA